jgi:hypothetical protein
MRTGELSLGINLKVMRGLCFAGTLLIARSPAFAQPPATFQGPRIPLPPEQNQLWTPPITKLSPATITAVEVLFKDGMADPRGCEYREVEVTNLLDMRISWGDLDAASEYASLVVGWDPNTAQGGALGFLDVISHHPDNSVLAAAAEKLFSDPSLGWINPSGSAFSSRVPIGTLRSPLIAVLAFRAVVLRALHNQAHAGSFTKNPNGVWIEPWSGRGLSFTKDDPAPPSDAVFDFRICDIYANEISYLPGGPKCSLFWPVEKRDKGVAACIAYLQRYGDNFRYDPDISQTALEEWFGKRRRFSSMEPGSASSDLQETRTLQAHLQCKRCPAPTSNFHCIGGKSALVLKQSSTDRAKRHSPKQDNLFFPK